jgi:hypothetical protein
MLYVKYSFKLVSIIYTLDYITSFRWLKPMIQLIYMLVVDMLYILYIVLIFHARKGQGCAQKRKGLCPRACLL